MPPVQRIYIAGFMGVGKSTVSPRVAKLLRFASMDLDDEIIRHLGLSIPGIFEVMGEDVFRQAEMELLMHASVTSSVVVSLGGGAVCRPETLQLCLDTGLLMYLKASPRYLANRLSRSRQSRPKLFDAEGLMMQGPKLEERIEELIADREPFYNQAHIIMDVEQKTSSQIAHQIVKLVQKWERE